MPLNINRWGYIPVNLEKFFGITNKSCQEVLSKKNVFKTCILRKGVELNDKQSFLACIADLLDDIKDFKPSIQLFFN